jgi:hypothetical protein
LMRVDARANVLHPLNTVKSMKISLFVIYGAILCGCASDPLMTGEAHDWVGHKMDDLIAAVGPPTRTIQQSDYNQSDPAIAKMFEGKTQGNITILEYVETGDTTSPKQSNISFGMHGQPGSIIGAHGGITTTDTPEHQSSYLNLTRFGVRNGIIVKWFQSHSVDGAVQWAHH